MCHVMLFQPIGLSDKLLSIRYSFCSNDNLLLTKTNRSVIEMTYLNEYNNSHKTLMNIYNLYCYKFTVIVIKIQTTSSLM